MDWTPAQLEEFKKALKKQTDEICKTKESAIAYLIKLGFLNEDGSYSELYYGPFDKKEG